MSSTRSVLRSRERAWNQPRAFVMEQPFLPMKAAAVACEPSVRADHAMAGEHQGDGVGAVGRTDRAHGGRTSDCARKIGVGPGSSGGDLAQLEPHVALEVR